jgi:hypothetical protein
MHGTSLADKTINEYPCYQLISLSDEGEEEE